MNVNDTGAWWIKAEDGSLVSLSHVEHIRIRVRDLETLVCADLVRGACITLCGCSELAEAEEALRRLANVLEISVLDMDADVLTPLNKDRREMERAGAAAGADCGACGDRPERCDIDYCPAPDKRKAATP